MVWRSKYDENVLPLSLWPLILFLGLISACGTLSTASPGYPPPPTRNQPTSALGYPIAQQPTSLAAYPPPTVATIPTVILPPEPAPDFAFSFGFGACNTDVLDTFRHTFTKDMIGEPSITIPLTLTVTEMTTIYQKMVAINFFGYPATYDTSAHADTTHGFVTPASSYHFRVRNGGQSKTVEWTDNIVPPPTADAERLQALAHLIVQIIQAHPEVQHLPVPKAACL